MDAVQKRTDTQCRLRTRQIAAIAKVHGFAVATRDVRPFRAAGVPVVNPWEDE